MNHWPKTNWNPPPSLINFDCVRSQQLHVKHEYSSLARHSCNLQILKKSPHNAGSKAKGNYPGNTNLIPYRLDLLRWKMNNLVNLTLLYTWICNIFLKWLAMKKQTQQTTKTSGVFLEHPPKQPCLEQGQVFSTANGSHELSNANEVKLQLFGYP